ncbi:DNA repair protein RecN [Alloprevotella rava]|uniref:DNA repair protein RecN n=1 Tax=Alloprevotella rava TaxID=671218 RepID=A0A7W5UKI0_9BACT|nr:DNA repair protein RecN [Alloprevotella rava]MBB3703011.1 DNA repair protein RecN (Recombination protein N) [Alloprevotella rava]
MLQHLHISNYALIEKLDINFSNGFSVITGETGAGKSIILGALGLIMGQRADAKAIKTGEKKCYIEAIFQVKGFQLEKLLKDNDIDFDEKECIVRREVTIQGKSRAFINDSPVPLSLLKEVSSHLIDIHSQHQNLLLGHEHFLIETLDTIAATPQVLLNYTTQYSAWQRANAELTKLQEQAAKDKSDTEFFKFQLQQLEEAQLVENEQEQLEEESNTLSHAEEIKQSLFQASGLFSTEEHNPVIELKISSQILSSIQKVFPIAGSLAERIDSVQIELEDIADELEHQLESVEFDPERQAFVDDRLNTIYSLEKKHNVETIAELLIKQEELKNFINKIENIDEEVAKKTAEVRKAEQAMYAAAKELTASRKKAAEKIEKELIAQLQELGMPGVRLSFSFERRSLPDNNGIDKVTFLFSANKNMAMQDVAQIASGGEIARLMLSLKAIISQCRNLPTIVFDEIDTGVSGTMAEKMAEVMNRMAENCQVLCITHLPQIAAIGVYHYRVFKKENEHGTSSHIDLLSTEERIQEIANMLSGAQMTDAAINNAKSLLKLQ